jgi:hypothetical protein
MPPAGNPLSIPSSSPLQSMHDFLIDLVLRHPGYNLTTLVILAYQELRVRRMLWLLHCVEVMPASPCGERMHGRMRSILFAAR